MKLRSITRALTAVGLGALLLSGPARSDEAAAPPAEELSDDAIVLNMLARRDYCKKIDPARAADFDKGVEALTPEEDDKTSVQTFLSRPDAAAAVAKRVSELEARDKDPEYAGAGKEMCDNLIKVQ